MRLLDAFHNFKAEIYARAEQQADNYTPEELSGDEDDNPDEGENLAEKNRGFQLDGDINLSSLFLDNVLSDEQRSQVELVSLMRDPLRVNIRTVRQSWV